MIHYFKTLLVLSFIVVLTSCYESLRTGEVTLHKIVPDKPILSKDRSKSAFLLRGRGFSAAENSHTISVESSYDKLHRYVLDMVLIAKKGHDDMNLSDPKQKQILKILTRLEQLEMETREKKKNNEQIDREIKNYNKTIQMLDDEWEYYKDIKKIYADFNEVSDSVSCMKKISKERWSKVVYLVMGQPLVSGMDWHKHENHLTKGQTYRCVSEENVRKIMLNETNNLLEKCDEDFDNQVFFVSNLFEKIINFVSALYGNGVPYAKSHGTEKPYTFKGILFDISITVEKILLNNRHLKERLHDSLKQLVSPNMEKINLVAEMESLAKKLSSVTDRDIFKKFKVSKSEKPECITVILKTLYVRLIDMDWHSNSVESANSELLVTASVKDSSNVNDESHTYPLIFEENFAPGHFVNRFDRFIYGPAPYNGKAMDFQFVVTELDDLENTSILNGFNALSSTITTFNPEYAALSPAVTAFFGSILTAATGNDVELDVSFTFMPPEGVKKSDVDFFITETGHYVLLKKENVKRRLHVNTWSGKSQEGRPQKYTNSTDASYAREVYKDLIYNPENSRLYWKKDRYDLEQNFVEDNLFLDQTYAVIAVTDEYTEQDTLGNSLRKQLSSVLGKRKAQSMFPNKEEIKEIFSSIQNNISGATVDSSEVEGFAQLSEELRKQLWEESSLIKRQVIVEKLYNYADKNSRMLFGRDPDAWQKGNWIFDQLKKQIVLSKKTLPNKFIQLKADGSHVAKGSMAVFDDVDQDLSGRDFVSFGPDGKIISTTTFPNFQVNANLLDVNKITTFDKEFFKVSVRHAETDDFEYSRKIYFRAPKPDFKITKLFLKKDILTVELDNAATIKDSDYISVSGSGNLKFTKQKVSSGTKEVIHVTAFVFKDIVNSEHIEKQSFAVAIPELKDFLNVSADNKFSTLANLKANLSAKAGCTLVAKSAGVTINTDNRTINTISAGAAGPFVFEVTGDYQSNSMTIEFEITIG